MWLQFFSHFKILSVLSFLKVVLFCHAEKSRKPFNTWSLFYLLYDCWACVLVYLYTCQRCNIGWKWTDLKDFTVLPMQCLGFFKVLAKIWPLLRILSNGIASFSQTIMCDLRTVCFFPKQHCAFFYLMTFGCCDVRIISCCLDTMAFCKHSCDHVHLYCAALTVVLLLKG